MKRKDRKTKIKPKSAKTILSRPLFSFSFCPSDIMMSMPPFNRNQRAVPMAAMIIRLIKTRIMSAPVVSSPPVGTPSGKGVSMGFSVSIFENPGMDNASFIIASSN